MRCYPPPRLFRIPELAFLIASHLTRRDISRLMRTSQQMYHTMTPIFFRNLSTSFHFKRDGSGVMLENSLGLEALARNAQHVREWDTGILFFNYYYHASTPFRTSSNDSIAPTAALRAAPPRPPPSRLVQLFAPNRPDDVYELTALPQLTWLTRINLNLIWNPRECNCRYPFPDYLSARTTLVRVCEILRLLPRLCQLDICELVIKDSGSARLFTSTLLEMTQLRRLDITLSRLWTYPGIRTLLLDNLPPSIERLYIGGTNSCVLAGDSGLEADNSDNRAMEAAQDPVRSTTKLANLQDLALDDWQESTTKEQFLSVFARCPGLETLRLKQPSAPVGVDGTNIGRICHDLRNISYDGSPDMNGNNKWLFDVMESLPENQMESLEFQSPSRCRLDDVTAVRTFLRHSGSLWQIKITSPVTSSAVRMILEMCKALEVLLISRSTVDLCDAIASPWACTKVTSLTLSIKISPSSSPPGTEFVPSYLQNPSTPLSAAEKDIFTQLEVFYQQIGKLTGLRHLNIGRVEFNEYGSVVGRCPMRKRPLPGMLILSTNRADRPGFLDVLGGLSKLETVGGAIFPETADGKIPESTISDNDRSVLMSDTSLSSLPSEIVQLIADRLNQHSLSQCSLVCHAWRSAFESSFWRSVQLLSYIRFENPSPSLEALTRNLHQIRQLATSDPTLIHHLAFHQSALSQLQFLKLYLFGNKSSFFTTESPEVDMARANNTKAISRILEGCHNLQVLNLWITDWFQQAGKTVGFQEIMSVCPTGSLKSILLTFETRDLIHLPQDPSQSAQEYQSDVVDQQKRLLPFIALQNVLIHAGNYHMHPSKLAFLARCPNLVKLELESPNECVLMDLADLLQAFCPNLVDLVWSSYRGYKDECAAAVLKSSRLGWRVMAPCHGSFGPLSYEAVVRSGGTLEELDMVICGSGSRDAHRSFFMDLFCTARNLRMLIGLKDGLRHFHEIAAEVHAETAFNQYIESGGDRTWELGPKMKYMQLQVVGVPRPDVVYRDNGTPMRSWMVERLDDSRRYEVQRWIYEQLGRMTGLEDLVLGMIDICLDDVGDYIPEDDDGDTELSLTELEDGMEEDGWLNRLINYQSLEFSLESGLELLEGMKMMRLLDVKATTHRIGVAELEWMHVHWPKLKEIKGLITERMWAGDAEEGTKVKQDVEVWMTAHPHGIGSSYYV